MESYNMSLSLFETEDNQCEFQNPFSNRKVIIEGDFQSFKRNTLKTRIKEFGGEVVSGDVTKNVHYFILGNNVSSEKLERYNKLVFNGFHIKTLSESDVQNIFCGNIEQYFVPEENIKDLHLTKEHYNKKHVIYQKKITDPSGREYISNPVYGKNLFLGQGITGNKNLLQQMLGLLGCFCGLGLDDTTQIIVLSHSAYDSLINGHGHPELTLIQDAYNRGLSQWYDYLLTTEEDLLTWIKSRNELFHDSTCEKLYNDFIASKKY